MPKILTMQRFSQGPVAIDAGGGGFAAPDIANVTFNDGTTGVFSNDYPSNITVINDPTGAWPGEKVCRLNYHLSGTGNLDDNTSISYTYPSGKTDLYQRMYVYQVDPGIQGGVDVELMSSGVQRKFWYINAGEGPDYWTSTINRWLDGATDTMDHGVYGPRALTVTPQPDFIETEFCCAIDFDLDTWYYYEYRVKCNTPGVYNDGIIQVWCGKKGASGLANAKIYEKLNADVRHDSTNNYLSCRVGQQLDIIMIGNTVDDTRYIKNLAISTQRIGP